MRRIHLGGVAFQPTRNEGDGTHFMSNYVEDDPNCGVAINISSSVLEAIRCIENSKLKIACVIDDGEILRGVVTNGDVRRHLISGGAVTDSVTCCMNSSFKSVGMRITRAEMKWRFGDAWALPRVDEDGRLVEVVTRKSVISPGKDVPVHDSHYKIIWTRANVTSADYIEPKLGSSLLFNDRQDLWRYALSKSSLDGIIAEFGVFSGESINFFARAIQHHNKRIFGFDSFEGLKEAWFGHEIPEGSFNLEGHAPTVLPNVSLVKGWFDQTLPGFLRENDGIFSFIHLDADTFESTALVLRLIGRRIAKNTVIVFDEYVGFPNWQNGEFRAWQEFVSAFDLQYRYLAFSPFQAAVQVL